MKMLSNFSQLAKEIKNDFRKLERDFARGVTLGTKEAGQGLKLGLRNQVRGAGLGPKVEKTWQSVSYPKSGVSNSAAVQVFSKAPKIIAAYDKGLVIRANKKLYLAIPTQNAPKTGIGGKRISPSNWPEHRFGPLRIVRTKTRRLLLVADNLRASYSRKTKELRGFRKASDKAIQKEKGLATVVMFILIPQMKVPKKLDVEREFKKWSAAYPDLVTQQVKNANNS